MPSHTKSVNIAHMRCSVLDFVSEVCYEKAFHMRRCGLSYIMDMEWAAQSYVRSKNS